MLQVSKLIPAGKGLAPVLLKRAATVELDWDVRQKSRFDATDSSGRRLGVFLPRGSVVRGGDVLVAEDGSLVRVLAAPQPVMQARVCPQHGRPGDLARAAYHLGRRHVPLQLADDHLGFEPDADLAALLDSMHLLVSEVRAPFDPEGEVQLPAHGHDHGHGHDHARHHGHDHAAHEHGAGCGCGHDHDHDTTGKRNGKCG